MNPYQSTLESFFQKIANLQHALFFLDNTMNGSYIQVSKKALESKADSKEVFGMLSRLVISDITGPTDNGCEFNYSTGFKKVIWFDTLRSEIDSLLSRESGFAIAQAYESFESFLKAMIAIAFYSNKFESRLKEFKEIDLGSFKSCSDYISLKVSAGTNNKAFFRILREMCPIYKGLEKNNNLFVDLYAYYYVVAEIRHALIHSELIIKNRRLEKLSSNHLNILKGLKITKKVEMGQELIIRKIDADKIIKRLTEIAFTIFKSLSIQFGFEWQVLKY